MTRVPFATTTGGRAMGVGVFTGVFAAAFEAIAVATAMPAAGEELGKIHLYGWVFSLFTIGMLIGTVSAGRLADRAGPIPALLLGGGVFSVGLVAGGFAPTMEALLAARFLQGLGAGFFNVALYVLIAHAYAEAARARMMAVLSAAWIVPAFVGPPIAAWLTTTFSWHWVFLGVLPLVAIAALLLAKPLVDFSRQHREGPAGDRNPAPPWTGVVLGLGVVGLQFAGQRASQPEGRDLIALAALLAGLVLLGIALRTLMPPGFLTLGTGMPAVQATRALVAGAFFGAEVFIPLILVQSRGLTLFWAGIVLTVGSVGWFAGSWVQAQSWFRLGREKMIFLGACTVSLGICGPALVATFPWIPLAVALAAWIVAGFGMGLVVTSTGLAVMTLSTPAQQGRNSSALQTAEALGTSVITGVAGTVFATLQGGASLAWTFGTVLWAMVGVCLWAIVRSSRIGLIVSPDHP